MSGCTNGEIIQETAEILTELHLKQDIDDVHDFFDSTSTSERRTSQSDTPVVQRIGAPDTLKYTSKKVTINISSKAKTRSDEGTIKELMNCIAYRTDVESKDDLRSTDPLSSDSSSDVTDVTPRSSSSGCSSLSRLGTSNSESSSSECSHNNESGKGQSSDKKPVHSLRFLKEMLDSTEPQKVSQSNIVTVNKRKPMVLSNKTFSRDQLRKIERENQILLRKIEENLNRRPKGQSTPVPPRPRISSSAVNRKRNQRKIDQDNLMLLRKIENVKSTVSSRTGLRRV